MWTVISRLKSVSKYILQLLAISSTLRSKVQKLGIDVKSQEYIEERAQVHFATSSKISPYTWKR